MNIEQKQLDALKNLLYKMADDQLILGHRNSEWTGFGPVLEEDIAFSSMAQDKIGQAYQLYSILNELGESEPDTVAFTRNAQQFHCCEYVTMPIGEYDFSLVRHFFFDNAELLRIDSLINTTFDPLSLLARKFKGELKYHVLHANTWIKQLANGNAESKKRIQDTINASFGLALGIFEPSDDENSLIDTGFFIGEKALQSKWLAIITPFLNSCDLSLPNIDDTKPVYGGRKGNFSQYLQPMLTEMTEVYAIDPSAEW